MDWWLVPGSTLRSPHKDLGVISDRNLAAAQQCRYCEQRLTSWTKLWSTLGFGTPTSSWNTVLPTSSSWCHCTFRWLGSAKKPLARPVAWSWSVAAAFSRAMVPVAGVVASRKKSWWKRPGLVRGCYELAEAQTLHVAAAAMSTTDCLRG